MGLAVWKMGGPLCAPVDYRGDSLLSLAVIQILGEEGWVWRSSRLGFPGGMDLLASPAADTGHFLILKGITLLGLSATQAFNLYYLLTFGLAAAAAAWTFRQLGASVPAAVAAAVAYACMPYHFLRVQHLFYAAYFMVPLACWVLLSWAASQTPLPERRHRWQLGVCFLLPAFGAYYAFFFCYLLGAALCLDALAGQGAARRRQGVRLVGVAVLGFIVNEVPHVGHRLLGNPAAALARFPHHTETYGLRLIQLLLPPPGHANPWLADLADTYNATAPLVNENATVALGLLLSLALVVSCLGPRAAASCGPPFPPGARQAAVLLLLAFLFGTLGGGSALFGYLVTPFIRAGNRICVYVAFLALGVATARLDRWAWATGDTARGRRWCWGVVGALALVGLWDLHDTRYFPRRETDAATFAGDAAFFAGLEASLPAGAAVLQLPYLGFPEGGAQARDYHPLRPFLHTRALRWSFGGVRGTDADRFYAGISKLAVTDAAAFRAALVHDGFCGVLLERNLPADVRGLEATLTGLFGPPARESADATFAYFASGSGGEVGAEPD
jgi:phosphoglycerol transferase